MKVDVHLELETGKDSSLTTLLLGGKPVWLGLALAGVLYISPLVAQAPPQQSEFFEKKIRPVLAEKCYACHGSEGAAMADLRLDSRAGVRKGGSRGPAIIPGRPKDSLLIKAISYRDVDLQMPPTGKLSDEAIADFAAWIEAGAPDPRDDEPEEPEQADINKEVIDLAKAREFWAFRPVRDILPPTAESSDWPLSPVDHFILAKLAEKGLAPAPPADRRTLLRRVSLDLIGLPPTTEEVAAFLADTSPRAFRRVVDRLLNSPHYGERWARHWLDLVRYAETNGHEYDNDKLNPWLYRDYVIEALNADLPYDQFVREHIAGDLLPNRRLGSDATHWSSPLATGFFWLGEVLNSATDSEKSRADQIDNQLDVLGKAFLGLTVACARCHDHKFDPIPTKDYYSLAGILHSTDMSEICTDSPSRTQKIAAIDHKVADLNRRIKSSLLREGLARQATTLKEDLLAAADKIATHGGRHPDEAKTGSKEVSSTWTEEPWVSYLHQALEDPGQVFHPFAVLAKPPAGGEPANFADRVAEVTSELREWLEKTEPDSAFQQERGDIVFEDFEKVQYEGWTAAGKAFGEGPTTSLAPQQLIVGYHGQGLANSFGSTDKLVGTLTSKKFRMPEKRYIHVLLAGTEGDKKLGENASLRLTLVADAFKAAHRAADGSGSLKWQTIHATKERGRMCYFEIVDRSREGHIAVERIVFSDSEAPPPLTTRPNRHVIALLEQPDLRSLEGLADAYQHLFREAFRRPEEDESRRLLASLPPTGRIEDTVKLLSAVEQRNIHELQRKRAALEEQLPPSSFAMTSADHEPHNVRVHIRGNHKNLGEEVPRRFLQIVAGENQKPFTNGSGRLEVAGWMARSENPLTARVIVNRLWKHHFGHGIVRTPDNFGKAGERPTHPDLLDFLARRLMEEGWSLKALHRLMVLSSTYQMSSRPSSKGTQVDPQNKLLSHMPVRRLEAEVIRDSILAASGTLNQRLFGPSVKPFIGEFQEGRGRPESGPVDGNGRRSIYLQLRRNFLTPMFLAFDYPPPISTIGQRGVSTVPSQALILLNNEFVNQQVGRWAAKVLENASGTDERISRMFMTAFARPPLQHETARVRAFLRKQQNSYGDAEQDDLRLWADLAHVLINSPEFVFVR